ncbi:MAG TPA: hypothetical protein VGM56_14225, partial [Byssovorax sp.]
SGFCCNSACNGTCQACSNALTGQPNGSCSSLVAGTTAPSGQCTASPPCGDDGKCGVGGACEQEPNTVTCGSAACTNGQLTTAATCTGAGSCGTGTTAACPGAVICLNATTCKPSCMSDADCQDPVNTYCSGGACIAKGVPGATCAANDQCTSSKCGTTGGGTHCCTAACSTAGACGATDCNSSGACVFPGFSTAPAALQTPGDCQKIVCDGSGGTTSVDDATDIPTSNSVCLTNPSCCGPSPLTPCFSDAPTGTSCTLTGDPAAHVCGDTSNSLVAGTCVECNTDVDCLGVNDAGTLTCNTSTGTCQ